MGVFTRTRTDLPGEPTSPWLASTLDASYESLETACAVDVCVVGGGLAGLSTAMELRERGQTVVVLERDRVGAGAIGHSSAMLTSQHGLVYDHLQRAFDLRSAQTYAAVNERALETVERHLETFELDCGFERQPSYCYGDNVDAIRREATASRDAGLSASVVRSVPPFERAAAAVRVDDQAWFHPRRYLLGLAETLHEDDGARIHEHTPVTSVEPGANPRVQTPDGTVVADHVVLATGFPLLEHVGLATRLYPNRSYTLGVRIGVDPPEGMYARVDDTARSVRTHDDATGPLLLVNGEAHKTGQTGSTLECYRRLLEWTYEHFPVETVEYRWSTQAYVSADRLPFVGRAGPGPESASVSIATGFGNWGVTTGVAAGRLLADAITPGEPDQLTRDALELFDPLRFTPKASLSATLTENADAMSQFATDWLQTLTSPSTASIQRGDGTVIRDGHRPLAVARDADGTLHAVSAVCTHASCLVDWNDAECTWDCPCHGSRFAPDGRVLEGPATEPLDRRRLE